MIRRLRILLFYGLMLVLPLQGFAAALGPVVCVSHGEADGHAAHASASTHHAQHTGGIAHTHDEQSSPADSSGHLCCHHFAPAVPVALESLPSPDLPPFASALSSLATLHVPDLPQRPPRP